MDSAGFQIVAAPKEAFPFVRRCLYANRPLAAAFRMRAKPTGYCYFTNWFGSSPGSGWIGDAVWYPQRSRFHLAGQIVEHEIEVTIRENLQIVFCELEPTACYRLFGVPGIALTGQAPALGELDEALEGLAARCFTSGADASRERHLEEVGAFFSELAAHARPADDAVEAAVQLFETNNGAIRVADICEQVDIGPRQLNRRFSRIVGVSPKFFGQVLQINWAVGMLYAKHSESLTALAQRAGFYDQAHLNRAMQRFFQEGPRAFLRSEHVAFETFLGASRGFGPSPAGTAPGRAAPAPPLAVPPPRERPRRRSL